MTKPLTAFCQLCKLSHSEIINTLLFAFDGVFDGLKRKNAEHYEEYCVSLCKNVHFFTLKCAVKHKLFLQ
jgi:hypothetical protein